MSSNVYITNLAKYLPNRAIENDEMETYLGKIGGKPSLARRIILRNNGIKKRYYALDEEGRSTHTNAQLTSLAVQQLFNLQFTAEQLELLTCGTTSPDQLLPSHTSMVHGLLGAKPVEIASFAGSCCTGMQALKYAYLSVLAGNSNNAVAAGSERFSRWTFAKNFDIEIEDLKKLEANPYVAFEKDFLRWMLSDGAGAALLQNQPSTDGLSLKIEWIEICSYASELETCMYAGGEKDENGNLIGWYEYPSNEWLTKSLFALKQDARLLGNNIIERGGDFLKEIAQKRNLDINSIAHYLPHLSSCFFVDKMEQTLKDIGLPIPMEKWFYNLTWVGNVGSASPYLMLEELFRSGRLKKGEKILLMAPESARFTYAFALLTVC